MFFALAIAQKTYFQKIADPKDISSTAAVGFTINHIAAVVLPAALGFIWIQSPGNVFIIGSVMAVISLLLALMVPRRPEQGRETSHWFQSVSLSRARLRCVCYILSIAVKAEEDSF